MNNSLSEEWLIYFKRSSKTFSVWIVSNDKEYTASGSYLYSGNVDIALELEASGKSAKMDLRIDKQAAPLRRLFGTAPLMGSIVSEGAEVGFCRVENSHKEKTPVIGIEVHQNPRCRLEARRSDPLLVECPLLVYGIDHCEITLGDYAALDQSRRNALPKTHPKRSFVGYCRTAPCKPPIIAPFIIEIGLVVSVAQLIVKDLYMRSV